MRSKLHSSSKGITSRTPSPSSETDSRSIDDLLSFIEAPESANTKSAVPKKKKSKKGKKSGPRLDSSDEMNTRETEITQELNATRESWNESSMLETSSEEFIKNKIASHLSSSSESLKSPPISNKSQSKNKKNSKKRQPQSVLQTELQPSNPVWFQSDTLEEMWEENDPEGDELIEEFRRRLETTPTVQYPVRLKSIDF